MISNPHSYIRSTDPDDAPHLARIYHADTLCCALLDQHREPMLPTVDELREVLASPEAAKGAFHTIEDNLGQIRGFVCLRGLSQDASFCEVSVLPLPDITLELPCFPEAIQFVLERAFVHHGLNKVLAHVLDTESSMRAFYNHHGFQSAGLQRQVLFAQGKYHDIETLLQWNPYGARRVAAASAAMMG